MTDPGSSWMMRMQRATQKCAAASKCCTSSTSDTFNPYQRQPEDRKGGGKRDLRKLSEHIKLMRELEERKQTAARKKSGRPSPRR